MRHRGTGRLQKRKGLFFLALIVVTVWTVGFLRFTHEIPSIISDEEGETDAIVVLTGGSGRLEEGFALLGKKAAKQLYVSGVYRGVDVQQLLERVQQSPTDMECCIHLGHNADNTVGNAVETADWFQKRGYRSMRLVTGNYHMPRSLLEFRHAMPGVRIVPHPVFPEHVKQENWWAWPGTASLLFREYNKFLFARLRQAVEGLITRHEK